MMNTWIKQSVFGRYWRQVQAWSVDGADSRSREMPGRWLAQAVDKDAERTALHLPDFSLSYVELANQVELFSTRLRCISDTPVIGICAKNPLLTLLCLFAAARLGRALLPLEAGMPEEQRNSMLSQSGCRLVVSDMALSLPHGVETVAGEDLLNLTEGMRDQPVNLTDASCLDPQRILLIVPTSGTCSSPKGVMLSAANLAASTIQVNAKLDLQADDCWINCLPLNHIAGLSIPYRCAEAGAAMVMHQGFNEDQVWRDLEEHRVSHISLVPAMLGRLLDAARGRMAPSSLRVALIGAGPLDPSLAKRAHAAGWPLMICYGMTETGSMCALDRTAQAGLKPGRVGEPMPGFQLMLSDDSQGEIWVAGEAVMAGYVNPQLKPGDGLQEGRFNTGDQGYWDNQGQLCVTGRADDLMNSGGLRLHPSEVEHLLEACPGLVSAAVSSRPDPLWGDRLVVVYEGFVSETWLEAWVRLYLPSGLRPREFLKVDALPRNRMGKLDRRALKQHIQSVHCVRSRAESWVSHPQGSA